MPTVTTVIDNVKAVTSTITGMTGKRVYVGVPSSNNARGDGPVGNAVIGYVMEHGDPKHNVPARPHLVPGIRAVHKETMDGLHKAARFALEGQETEMMKALSAIGLRAVSSVKNVIRSKIPPPLAESTIAARLRRTQAGQRRLKRMRNQGTDLAKWGAQNLTPLIDTSSYIKSITYVVRDSATGKEMKGD